MVSIAAFQAVDPGSIPGRRIVFCDVSFLLSCSLNGRKSSKCWIIFTSGDSAKEKCFQSRVKKKESRSILYIAIQRIENFETLSSLLGTAIFSVVTQRSSPQWGGALRDDSQNGCVAD